MRPMPVNRIASILLVTILVVGCSTSGALKEPPPGPPVLLGVFEGTLPCADCPGIKTRLTLIQEAKYHDIGRFTLERTYLERKVQPFVEKGDWTVLRGNQTFPEAVIYELTPDGSKPLEYFRKVGDKKIIALDGNGEEIKSKLHFSLIRQPQ